MRNQTASSLSGLFGPRSQPAEAGEGEEHAPAEEAAETKNTDPTETRYERARRAFLRNGWKDDEFAKLDRDHAIRRGLKLERQQNRQAAEYARLKTEVDRKGKTASGTTSDGTHSGVPSSPVDARLADLLSKHGLDGDPEFKSEFTSIVSPLLDRVAELEASIERSQAEGSEADQLARMNKARAELSKTFTDLSDDDEFEDVLRTALALKNSPQFAGYESDDTALLHLLTAAARALDLEHVGERETGATWSSGSAASGSVDRSRVASSRTSEEEPTGVLANATPVLRRIVQAKLEALSKQRSVIARK